ncbi:MAG TPA: hypothetical protein VI339_02850, partial [Steroidobacteraceae bacterium]|nr:hypothetical protein [Steroidobacteraceae bacterium]
MQIRRLGRRLATSAAAALPVILGLAHVPMAQAVDTEVFFTQVLDEGGKPNILFILDTSQSMYTVEDSSPVAAYDLLTTYAGSCDTAAYYWAQTGGSTPVCGAGAAPLDVNQFNCPLWRASVDLNGFLTQGNAQVQQYNPSKNPANKRWNQIVQSSLHTVCRVGGVNDYNAALLPAPSNPPSWSANKPAVSSYTFYDGNYLNYLNAAGGGGKYRIDVVREVVAQLAENTNGVRMGLMRYGYDGSRVLSVNTATECLDEWNPDESSRSGNGAPIVYPITDMDGAGVSGGFHIGATAREQFRFELGVDDDGNVESYTVNPSIVDSLQPQRIVHGGGNNCPIPLFVPGGRSPIAGAMMEAFLYYSGGEVSRKYGENTEFGSTYGYPSVDSARNGDNYVSPITDSCSKNYIILLSDGTTEQDNDIDGPTRQLPGFEEAIGDNDCDDDPYLDAVGTPPPSQCVDDLAEYMFETDMRSGVAGINNVITYTVGFKLGSDAAANSARSLLQETATRGGGVFYEAGDAASLEAILTDVVRQVLTDNASFTAPAVTVNAFNRTQNLNDLYMSLFRPSFDYRWLGNLKKFRIEPDGDIVDASSPPNPAVDPSTGFFRSTVQSYWSPSVDGADITAGGAASQLVYSSRNIYTNIGDDSNVSLSAAANALSAIKSLDDATARSLLGLGAADATTADDLVDWLYGKDIGDVDGDTVFDESREDMGDPLHSRPVTVIYGGTAASPDIDDGAVFLTTNDGVLHAFNPVNGAEYWAFMPQNLLDRARDLYTNDRTEPEDRDYGLDGAIRVVRTDVNRNGIVEPGDGDKVYLYFGQRRGGSSYYGVDVSTKTAPQLMWAIDGSDLPGSGQSWASPARATVQIDTEEKQVLFFGGGYNTGQDQQPFAADTTGNRIYMVDALTGALLWRAGPTTDSGANLQLAAMTNAISGDVRPIDMTGDGFADRVYAADLGGRIFRFDIYNGNTVTGSEGDRLVEGGLFASLGNAEDSPRDETNTLRFFFAPDPALVTIAGQTIINIAIGSGHRELPATDVTTQDWFFGIRDYHVFQQLLSSQYTASCPSPATGPCHQIVREGDLVDLTNLVGDAATAAVPIGSPGWRFRLNSATGEKALAESRTFQGDVFFTTYAPEAREATGACSIAFGQSRLYVVSAVDARPVNNNDGSTDETTDDRDRELNQSGIPPEV